MGAPVWRGTGSGNCVTNCASRNDNIILSLIHIYTFTISKNSWSLIEHNDKSDPASKTKSHAKVEVETAFDATETYTLLLECKGEQVVAQIVGKESLKASAPDFRVKKPSLVFRMGGKDGQEVIFDNMKVWALK